MKVTIEVELAVIGAIRAGVRGTSPALARSATDAQLATAFMQLLYNDQTEEKPLDMITAEMTDFADQLIELLPS